MDVAETAKNAQSIESALKTGRELIDAGDLRGGWMAYSQALRSNPQDERLLLAAADTWVAAVDQNQLASFPLTERRQIETLLIEQQDCDVSPPVFHHRIAAQHSSGLHGHLERAAKALEPLLQQLLARDTASSNLVLMLLLLRSKIRGIPQSRISKLHQEHFKRLKVGDLAIPYSVMFHRQDFSANAQDLGRMASAEREIIAVGGWPLTHVLLALWLCPDAFEGHIDWSASAVRNRLAETSAEEEIKSARSLALRFNGQAHRELAHKGFYGDPAKFLEAMEDLAEGRKRLQSSTRTSAAEKRLDRTVSQIASAAWNQTATQAPILRRLRRKPKVAICVSGQLRGFRKSLATWKRSLLPALDATFFVSSWKRTGRAGAEPFRYVLPFEGANFQHEYRAIGTELGLGVLQERYPSLFEELERSATIDEEELSRVYETPHVHLDDDALPPFQSLTNPGKMHYKIEHSFRMAEASGEEFDLVIRIRPDKPTGIVALDWNDVVGATRGQPRLYCETAMGVHFGALEIGDQFSVGGLEASRIYHETWSRAPALAQFGLRMFHPEFTGHVSLAQICWLHGISVKKAPIRFGELQDPDPLDVRRIRETLAADAERRMDAIDRRLIIANQKDCGP